jgi:hypothetical protein
MSEASRELKRTLVGRRIVKVRAEHGDLTLWLDDGTRLELYADSMGGLEHIRWNLHKGTDAAVDRPPEDDDYSYDLTVGGMGGLDDWVRRVYTQLEDEARAAHYELTIHKRGERDVTISRGDSWLGVVMAVLVSNHPGRKEQIWFKAWDASSDENRWYFRTTDLNGACRHIASHVTTHLRIPG